MQTALPIASGLTNAEKAKLWAAADKLRGHLDAAEYKHVVLGLIFLKYISDAFEEDDAAMEALERENPTLRDVLPKGFARPTLDKTRLGELIDLFTNLDIGGKQR